MKNLTDIFLKARSGVYKDTSENRRLHRVGQKYGESKQPEDDEKDKKEVDPAKELEAVNKVIEAINNKKMTLPPDQIMVLIEKKNKLELAKKQAEKINAGVKANEEKRNVKEVKETNKKINEASKRKKKYGDMNVEEAKKELLGKDLTITDIETGKTRTEKITSILEGNVRGHETVMARVEGGGTYPIKHIDTGKEWKAWKLNLNSPSLNKEAKPTETSENNEEKQKIANRIEKVFAKVSADENVEQNLLREYVKNRIKDSAFDTEILTSKVKDNLNKMIGHLKETEEGKEILKELKKFKGTKQLSSEKELEAIDKIIDNVNNGTQVVSKEVMDKLLDKKSKLGANTSKKEDTPKETQKKDSEKKEEENNLQRRKELSEKVERLIAEKKKKFPNPDIESPMSDEEKRLTKEIADTWSEINKLIRENRKTKEEPKFEPKYGEAEESYTRVKFDDLPNSGKVNLKKYLSDKVKRTADENLGILSKVSTENLKKMEAGLVKEFNSQFDDLPKSRRAEKLYSIMKVKAELAQRGSETKNGENNSNKNIKKAVEEVSANFENLADKVDKNGWNMQYIKYGDIDSFDFDEKDSTLTVHATGKGYGNTKSTKTELTQKDFDEYNKTAKWVTNFRGEREPVTTDAHGAITIAKELKDKGIDVKKL